MTSTKNYSMIFGIASLNLGARQKQVNMSGRPKLLQPLAELSAVLP
jgi:hypothetical protein